MYKKGKARYAVIIPVLCNQGNSRICLVMVSITTSNVYQTKNKEIARKILFLLPRIEYATMRSSMRMPLNNPNCATSFMHLQLSYLKILRSNGGRLSNRFGFRVSGFGFRVPGSLFEDHYFFVSDSKAKTF